MSAGLIVERGAQSTLFRKPPAQKKSNLCVSAGHDENNLRTAKEILECPEKWGGEDAGLVQWARIVVARLGHVSTKG